MTPRERKPRPARLTIAYWLDQLSNLTHILVAAGVLHGGALRWVALIGALGGYGAMKLTEPRRPWTPRERMECGLDPVPPPLYAPPPLPPAEDDAPTEELPPTGSGRGRSGRSQR